MNLDLDRERLVNSEQGRRGWLREGRRRLDELRREQTRRLPALVASGCTSQATGLRRSTRSRSSPTRHMRPTGRRPGTGEDGGSAAHPIGTRCRSSRRA